MIARGAAVGFALTLASCGARTEIRGGTPSEASPPDPGPDFVWYKLDETSGATAHDSSSHHWDVGLPGVSWNDGAVFDGATVCGSTNVSEAFRVPPVTITAWLTPSARDDETENAYALTPFPPDALSGDVPSAGGYGLGLDVWTDGGGGNALAVETGINAGVAFHSLDGSFADGARHFAAVVIDSGSASIYADGKLTAQASDDIPPAITPTPLHLGCHNDDAAYGTKRFYRGRMRDARIYKRALGADEIAQLFANGPA